MSATFLRHYRFVSSHRVRAKPRSVNQFCAALVLRDFSGHGCKAIGLNRNDKGFGRLTGDVDRVRVGAEMARCGSVITAPSIFICRSHKTTSGNCAGFMVPAA